MEACSDALYEYEGIDKGVSRRTVQADIQLMRSDKLGYNAPIIVVDRKYYMYDDSEYSITNSPVSEADLERLSETIGFLQQFQNFDHFKELGAMVQKLEDHVYAKKTRTAEVISIERNDDLVGIGYLSRIYKAIQQSYPLEITYQSFKARQPSTITFHPYLLKEHRNRWFVIGRNQKSDQLLNLALDRIREINRSSKAFLPNENFDPERHFQHVIGVTVNVNEEPQEVILRFNRNTSPYVLTKPLHSSQKFLGRDERGTVVSLTVQWNYELERDLLSFGENVQVLAPERLKRSIRQRLSEAIDVYNTELSERGLTVLKSKLTYRGSGVIDHAMRHRSIKAMKREIRGYLESKKTDPYAIRNVLGEIPQLSSHLFLPNLKSIITRIDKNARLIKSIYFDKNKESNWKVNWHQDRTINVQEKHEVEGFSGWLKKDGYYSVMPPESFMQKVFTLRIHLDDCHKQNGALMILTGSHKRIHDDNQIKTIVDNAIPSSIEVNAGAVHVMHPLLLHASGSSNSKKQRRVIHLEFTSAELPEELSWAESFEWNT
ncbi:MAG: WYL domain-containing protein [Flavobacteriales bacterium]|nr:WYL domain-containing protein [Flavobacteriales bacterium]